MRAGRFDYSGLEVGGEPLLCLVSPVAGSRAVPVAGARCDRAGTQMAEQRYLLVPTGLQNLGEGDAASAYTAFSQAAEIGGRLGERHLTAFGQPGQCQALIARERWLRASPCSTSDGRGHGGEVSCPAPDRLPPLPPAASLPSPVCAPAHHRHHGSIASAQPSAWLIRQAPGQPAQARPAKAQRAQAPRPAQPTQTEPTGVSTQKRQPRPQDLGSLHDHRSGRWLGVECHVSGGACRHGRRHLRVAGGDARSALPCRAPTGSPPPAIWQAAASLARTRRGPSVGPGRDPRS